MMLACWGADLSRAAPHHLTPSPRVGGGGERRSSYFDVMSNLKSLPGTVASRVDAVFHLAGMVFFPTDSGLSFSAFGFSRRRIWTLFFPSGASPAKLPSLIGR